MPDSHHISFREWGHHSTLTLLPVVAKPGAEASFAQRKFPMGFDILVGTG